MFLLNAFKFIVYKYTRMKQINRINRLIREQDNLYQEFIFKLNINKRLTKIPKSKLIGTQTMPG